jgi:hypothetical protein
VEKAEQPLLAGRELSFATHAMQNNHAEGAVIRDLKNGR